MPYPLGTRIGAPLTNGDAQATFGTHIDYLGVGGFRSVTTIAERNAIPVKAVIEYDGGGSGQRREGMVVYCQDTKKTYQLVITGYSLLADADKLVKLADNANWNHIQFGVNADGEYIEDVTYDALTQTLTIYTNVTTRSFPLASLPQDSLAPASGILAPSVNAVNVGLDALNAALVVERDRLNNLVTGAPGALDTLAEIANQIAADQNGVAGILATQNQHTTKLDTLKPVIAGTNIAFDTTTAPGSIVINAVVGTTIDETNLVHRTGDESIAGLKTFTNDVVINGSPRGTAANLRTRGDVVIGERSAILFNGVYSYGGGAYIGDLESSGRVDISVKGFTTKFHIDGGIEAPGNVKAVKFIGDGSQLTNLPVITEVQNSLTPGSTTLAPSVTLVNAELATKAPLASPAFNGTPTVPTAANGSNSGQIANTAFVANLVSPLLTGNAVVHRTGFSPQHTNVFLGVRNGDNTEHDLIELRGMYGNLYLRNRDYNIRGYGLIVNSVWMVDGGVGRKITVNGITSTGTWYIHESSDDGTQNGQIANINFCNIPVLLSFQAFSGGARDRHTFSFCNIGYVGRAAAYNGQPGHTLNFDHCVFGKDVNSGFLVGDYNPGEMSARFNNCTFRLNGTAQLSSGNSVYPNLQFHNCNVVRADGSSYFLDNAGSTGTGTGTGSAATPATTTTLGSIIVGNGLLVDAAGSVSTVADVTKLTIANNLSDLSNKQTAIANLLSSAFLSSYNASSFSGGAFVLNGHPDLLTTSQKNKLAGSAYLQYSSNVGINFYDGGIESYLAGGQAGINPLGEGTGIHSNVVSLSRSNGGNAAQIAGAMVLFNDHYTKMPQPGSRYVMTSPNGATLGKLGVDNEGGVMWNGKGVVTVNRTTTTVTFDRDAEYNPVNSGTFTVNNAGKVVGAVVCIYLGTSATQPTIPTTGYKLLSGAFAAGTNMMYMFKVGANNQIQYTITNVD